VAVEILLVEVQLLAADRSRGAQISRRELCRARSRCRSSRVATERKTIEHRKSVRRANRIHDLPGARCTREAIESRTADGEAVLRQLNDAARVRLRRCGRVDQGLLVLPPQRAERFAIDPFEYA